MQPLSEIKTLLESRGLAPRQSLGQNFLTDHNLIRKLVDASGVQAGDLVLEIGPGTGTLTEELLARNCRVVACELDRGLAQLLRERLGSNPNFTLVEGDCLDTKRTINAEAIQALHAAAGNPASPPPFRLVANLPYGAATPVMGVLLTSHPTCSGLFVTIQREVADRLAASPGSKDYGNLSVIAQSCAKVSLIAKLPPECFWPRPEIHSAMVALTRLPTPRCDNIPALADFCQSLFEKRRKQLGAVLGREGPWPEGIQPTDRAEALSVDQLIALYRSRRTDESQTPQ